MKVDAKSFTAVGEGPTVSRKSQKFDEWERKLINKTIDQYLDMAKNGPLSKEGYFQRHSIHPSERPLANCYLCEAWNPNVVGGDDCGNCPLSFGMYQGCLVNIKESPFVRWSSAADRGRIDEAREACWGMAGFLIRELAGGSPPEKQENHYVGCKFTASAWETILPPPIGGIISSFQWHRPEQTGPQKSLVDMISGEMGVIVGPIPDAAGLAGEIVLATCDRVISLHDPGKAWSKGRRKSYPWSKYTVEILPDSFRLELRPRKAGSIKSDGPAGGDRLQ